MCTNVPRPKYTLLTIPVVLTILFIARFAGPLPLTDEWTFVKNAIALQTGTPYSGLDLTIANHPIVIPQLAYLGVAELFNYDSRAIIALTLISFTVILWASNTRLRLGFWELTIASIVFFGTGHYMEYLWGNQFTLAWSMAFPILGLVLADQIEDSAPLGQNCARLLAALGLVGAGTLCSAGGAFGFLSLSILIGLKQVSKWFKTGSIAISSCIFLILAQKLSSNAPIDYSIPLVIAKSLTALGAVLIGSEVGTIDFSFSPQLASGALVAILLVASILLGIRIRPFPAFSLALTAFGVLCLLSIVTSRPYLGNWHLQYVLPIMLGLMGVSSSATRADKNLGSSARKLHLTTYACLGSLATYGYAQGFLSYGPSYQKYTQTIERYALSFLVRPGQSLPFPRPEHTLDKQIIFFLSARNNPLFKAQNEAWLRSASHRQTIHPRRIISTPEKQTSGAGLPDPYSRRFQPIEVVFSRDQLAAQAVVLRSSSGYTLTLRRLNPSIVDTKISADEVAYGGMALRSETISTSLIFQPTD